MKLRVVEASEWVTLESLHTPGTRITLENGRVVRSREQVALLLQTAAQVLDESNLDWQQGMWTTVNEAPSLGYCNTAGCFAGHALANAEIPVIWTFNCLHPAVQESSCKYGLRLVVWSWHETAKTVLGLTLNEAAHLFDSKNTRADIRRCTNEIVARTEYLETPVVGVSL